MFVHGDTGRRERVQMCTTKCIYKKAIETTGINGVERKRERGYGKTAEGPGGIPGRLPGRSMSVKFAMAKAVVFNYTINRHVLIKYFGYDYVI